MFKWRNQIFILLVMIFYSCVSNIVKTEPNQPFKGPYPKSLKILSQKNKLLADEICKLPEIIDGISDSEIDTLEKLLQLYNKDQALFDSVFEDMYSIGKPEKRKFCSTLQAFFWVVELGDIQLSQSLLEDYTLNRLLNHAWMNKNSEEDFLVEWKLLELESEKLYKSCIDTKIKIKIDNFMKNGEKAELFIIGKAREFPDAFAYKFNDKLFDNLRKINFNVELLHKFNKVNKKKWNDFQTVIDRLNAPELIQYYLNDNVTYLKDHKEDWQSPEQTFKNKKGDCEDFATFAAYCCLKAGYPVKIVLNIFKPFPKTIPRKKVGHAVGAFANDNKYFIIGDTDGRIKGPYASYHKLGKAIHAKGEVFVLNYGEALELGGYITTDTIN